MTSNPPPPKAGQAQKWTLGKGFNDSEMDERLNGEYSGPKYADLGIYKDGKPVLPLGIDHHEIRLDLGREWDVNALRSVFTELTDAANSHSSLLASHERLKQALEPVAKFIEAFDRKPIKMHDEFYGIHTGTEFEASLKLSDLRAIATALSTAHSVNNG